MAAQKSVLTENHRDRRLRFGRPHARYTAEDCRKVMFSGEPSFSMRMVKESESGDLKAKGNIWRRIYFFLPEGNELFSLLRQHSVQQKSKQQRNLNNSLPRTSLPSVRSIRPPHILLLLLLIKRVLSLCRYQTSNIQMFQPAAA